MVATMRAIRAVGVVLIETASVNACPSYATFTAAVRTFVVIIEIVVIVVVWVSHLLSLLMTWGLGLRVHRA